MKSPKQASLSEADVLALLDGEERAELLTHLSLQQPLDVVRTQLPIGRLIAEIVQLRQPFVMMMHEVAVLLEKLEASVRGNVRFVLLPGSDLDLSLDFGPQLRKVVATALHSKLLVNHWDTIKNRTAELETTIRSHCDRVVATPIQRLNRHGELLDRLSDLVEREDPIQSQIYKRMIDTHSAFSESEQEYNGADKNTLRQIRDGLSDLEHMIARLEPGSSRLPQLVPDVQTLLQYSKKMVQTKLQQAEPVSETRPFATRRTTDADLQYATGCIDRLKEAILSACEYVDSIDSLFDFLNLEIWKQRWRVYELWVLAHVVLQLLAAGAEISDTGRIADGIWRLKFTKDDAAILGLAHDGQIIDLYYQFYQARNGAGDMPDIAFRLRGDRFICVIDPKHGKTYNRSDLNDVCTRYASAFNPYLSCVVNYFDLRVSEDLNGSTRSLVLYGLRPQSDATRRFDDELIGAVDRCWFDRGWESVRSLTIVALLDGSSSTDRCRESLLERFDLMLLGLCSPLRPQSRAFVFGTSILREGPIADLSSRELVRNLPGSGTDFEHAFHSIRQKMLTMPPPLELWIFTDGEGLGDLTAFEAAIKGTDFRIRIVESAHNNATPLKELCARIGGEHFRL